MTAKLLARLAAGLGVLIVAWVVLALVRRPASDQPVAMSLPRVDSASVDSIVLSRRGDTTVIARAGKTWRANGYGADTAALRAFLKALADSSRSSELIAESRASHVRLGVTADSGREVRVSSHGRVRLDMIVGNRTSDYEGVYARRPNENAVYAVRGSLADPLSRSDDDWRDKRIVAVSSDSVRSIEVARGTQRFSLRREGKGWTFASGRRADTSAVTSVLGEYRELRAASFPTRRQLDSVRLSLPSARVRLLSAGAKPLADVVFDSSGAGIWTRADSSGPVFRVDSWAWSRLVPAESTLFVKRKPDLKVGNTQKTRRASSNPKPKALNPKP